ncbi:MAG: hypothetical protein Kow0069_27200 [Promethearchaeota archaeon]
MKGKEFSTPAGDETGTLGLTARWGLARGYSWDWLLGACFLLACAGAIGFFLEGKSSHDVAFTLWDDANARVYVEPMGRVVVPQEVFYLAFVAATAALVAWWSHPSFGSFRKCGAGVLLSLTASLLALQATWGSVQAQYLGVRQGPAGWVALERPWVSALAFCAASAAGLLGFQSALLGSPPLPSHEKDRRAVLANRAAWALRVLVVVGTAAGCFGLVAALVEALGTTAANFAAGFAGAAGAAVLLAANPGGWDGKAFRKRALAERGESMFAKRWSWLTDPSAGPPLDPDRFGVPVNPRTRPWRTARYAGLVVLLLAWVALATATAFMTIPDEWVFRRVLQILPGVACGAALGAAAAVACPDPTPFALAGVVEAGWAYEAFLRKFTLPMEPWFAALQGAALGWAAFAFASLQLSNFRARDPGRHFNLTTWTAVAGCVAWMLVNYVDRFQHAGQMAQEPVTTVVRPLVTGVTTLGWALLVAGAAAWVLEGLILRRRRPTASTKAGAGRGTKAGGGTAVLAKGPAAGRTPQAKPRTTALAAAVAALVLIPPLVVHGAAFVPNATRPALLVNDRFVAWWAPGDFKVERTAKVAFAGREASVNVSLARGEWEGFHLLLTPRDKSVVTLDRVNWTGLDRVGGGGHVDRRSVEAFLVHYEVDEQPDRLTVVSPGTVRRAGEHLDLFWRVRVPRNATAGQYSATLYLSVDGEVHEVKLGVRVFAFALPRDRHLRSNFGGGWKSDAWYDELSLLRVSQYDAGVPFEEGEQYWWNGTTGRFEFNWTAHDEAFAAQLARGFTGTRLAYWPERPEEVTDDDEWALLEAYFLANVSAHLESHAWADELGVTHTWVEIPYNYLTDEPPTSKYPWIRELADRYHAEIIGGASKLRTMVTEEYRPDQPVLHDAIDVWCPVISAFDPAAVVDRHAAGQQYWFYVCVGPTAPYPNLQLWEPGHDPRLLPLLCAGFGADGFLYWSMTAGNSTFRAGFDGNGDGQVAFWDDAAGRPWPSLRLLSYAAGVEDFEYVWLMRTTVSAPSLAGLIPGELLDRAAALEARLAALVGPKPQFVNHDAGELHAFRADLADLLEDLWPYSSTLLSNLAPSP